MFFVNITLKKIFLNNSYVNLILHYYLKCKQIGFFFWNFKRNHRYGHIHVFKTRFFPMFRKHEHQCSLLYNLLFI